MSHDNSEEASDLLSQDKPSNSSDEGLSTPVPETSDDNSELASSLLNQDTPSNNSDGVPSTPLPETSDDNSEVASDLLNEGTPSNNSEEDLSTPVPETSDDNSEVASDLLNEDTPSNNSDEGLSTPVPETSADNSELASSLLNQDTPSNNSDGVPSTPVPETSDDNSELASSLLNQDTPSNNSDGVPSTPVPETSDDNSEVASDLLNEDTPSNNSDEGLSTPVPETSDDNSELASSLLNQDTPSNNSDEGLSTPVPETSDDNSEEASSLLNQDTPSNNSDEGLSTPVPETSDDNSEVASDLLNEDTPSNNSEEDLSTPVPETSDDNSEVASDLLNEDTPSNNSGAITESFEIRDASTENEVYEKYLREYHPNYMEMVYRVPWTYIGTSSSQGKEYKTQNNERFPRWNLKEEHIEGDNAEKRVADSLEWLLKREAYPAFILTSYNFSNFCNQNNQPPPGDENCSSLEGEHDIVIIHYKYGMFFIQVKACSENTKQVKKAKHQLSKDIDFFKNNFKTFEGTISTFIALPNIKNESLPQRDRLFDDHLPCYSLEPERREERLRSWWTKQTSNLTGFASFAEYRRVVAKYIGWKSTVKVPMFNSVRSPAVVVAEMGNRCMNITLTPQQIYILNNHLPRLVIRGEHGSGKTVMLILKAREMIAQKVCLISMAQSPLLKVLDEAVKYDTNALLQNNVSVMQAGDVFELTKMLNICAKEKRHVFIDEVPSSLQNNESLKEAISGYPEECWIWAIMSSEKADEMALSLKEIFRYKNSTFAIAVFNKVLRCPPSIFPRHMATQNTGETFTFEGSVVKEFFKSHGLEPQSTPRAESKPANNSHEVPFVPGSATPGHKSGGPAHELRPKSTPRADSMQWSYFTVVDNMTKQMNIVQWLKQLLQCQIPHMAAYSEEESFLNVVEENGTGMVRLTNRVRPHFVQSYQRIPIKDGGDLYITRVCKVKEIDSMKKLARVLYSNGICTQKIKLCLKEHTTGKDRRNMKDTLEPIVVVKSYLYYFLENLRYPVITPDSLDVLQSNAILLTTDTNLAGFERKMVLRISNTKVRVNQEVQRIEGPKPLMVDHSGHAGPVHECKTCQDELNGIFGDLGLGKISVDQTVKSESEQRSRNPMEQHKQPNLELGLWDVVVLDDRQPKHDVINLLNKINIPPEVSPYGYEDRVVYTTPDMFRGLEKKVVLVITDNDCTDLAVSRCSSQLIVLKTNCDPSGTSACTRSCQLTALCIILLLVYLVIVFAASQ
ncbi:uncharacterized protein [Haliotis asinina]|uniref:uncharacterized protein n=1 Tax=Haliotis asinina TaxID=109174 RepID=UPI0035321451